MPGLTHWQHPQFFGYFPCNGTLASVLGDYVSTGLGVLGLAWQSSPALTELEEVVTDWMRQMLGLSGAWSGVIQDTASTSTLVALICARERTTDYSLGRGGLQGRAEPLVVYTSAHSHSSVDKAALLAGFGRENLRIVPYDAQLRDAGRCARAIDCRGPRRGPHPCAVVATTGTTTTTALDPIAAIAAVAARRNVWLHVDAAMAGSAMILPECRWMWDGVEGADSLVDQPAQVARRGVRLLDLLRARPRAPGARDVDQSQLPAIGGRRPGEEPSRLGHSARPALPRAEAVVPDSRAGRRRLQARLRRDLAERALARRAGARRRRAGACSRRCRCRRVCVRHEPPGLDGEALDRHTRDWAERVNRSGDAYLTPAVLDGRWMVRVSVGAEQTEREHVAAGWTAIRQAAEAE